MRRQLTTAACAAAALVLTGSAVPALAGTAGRAPARAVTAQAVPAAVHAASAFTGTTCSPSCDLWAKTGTTTVNGTSLAVWGFSTTADGAATSPGPVLEATAGQSVTLHLHNTLPENVSLVVPGLHVGDFAASAAKDTGTIDYTFTPSSPGTYLYQAGHTPTGARQVALGLVGALVVRPADASSSAYGSGHGDYDDEAALVLTEIDPRLSAAAASATTLAAYDVRGFDPAYRLINGKAYPDTAPVPTANGHRVLLRYLNGGVVPHTMSVMGADQLVVGEDGHERIRPASGATAAVPLPTRQVAVPLDPGTTRDAVVTVPAAADGSRFAVYESAGRLDSNGAKTSTAATAQVALGGMLTFLDAGAPAAGTDTVGPLVSGLAAAPATVVTGPTATFQLTGSASDAANGGSGVSAAQYAVDDTAATPTAMTVGAGDPSALSAGVPAPSSLLSGSHTVYVRAQDGAGNWGPWTSVVFKAASSGPRTTGLSLSPSPTNGLADVAVTATGDDSVLGGTVDGMEMYVGASTTPIPMTVATGRTVVSAVGTLPQTVLAGEPVGPLTVKVRSHDSLGLWGDLVSATLTLDRDKPVVTSSAVQPDPTNGKAGSAIDATALEVDATFQDRDAIDGTGTAIPGTSSTVVAAEGFLDGAPADPDGLGFPFLSRTGTFDAATVSTYGLIPLSQLTQLADGQHRVLVHAKDAAGNWGALTPVTFTVDRGAPTVTALSATNVTVPNPSVLSGTATDGGTGIAAAEWFVGTDPGAGNGTTMTVTPAGGTSVTLSGSVPTSRTTVGTRTVSVRVRDRAGTWSALRTATFTVSPRVLFATNFNAFAVGSSPSFAGTSAGPAANRTVQTRLNADRWLRVTSSGTATYLADTTPTAESTWTGSFDLNAAGTTGAGSFAVLRAVRATGAQVLQVEVQRTAAGTVQVRLLANRGVGSATTAWRTVTGTATVRVEWTAGLAGTARLVVNGSTVGTLTGNTGTLRVDTVQLGSQRLTGSAAGFVYLDNYTSTQ